MVSHLALLNGFLCCLMFNYFPLFCTYDFIIFSYFVKTARTVKAHISWIFKTFSGNYGNLAKNLVEINDKHCH